MSKFIIIQTSTPDYRAGFFARLQKQLKENFQLYAGEAYFEPSIQSDRNIDFIPLRNHFFFNRKLLFQTGLWHLLFSNHILVLEMNPRILSNWFFLLIRKLLRRKTILWGHAWPRSGKGSKSDQLRNLMRKMSTAIIVYTHTQKLELEEKMKDIPVFAAPNALLSLKKMSAEYHEPQHLIYVGRLVPEKKPFFLVKVFHHCLTFLPEKTKLYIVGEGEEAAKIGSYIDNYGLHDRILLMGHISDYEMLKGLYQKAMFSVSPGYGGLSITQSFSFGVPILISENEPHSPEIEAIKEGFNAVFYETDSTVDFNNKLLEIVKERKKWLQKRKEIMLFCKENYSIESMAQVFIKVYQTYES